MSKKRYKREFKLLYALNTELPIAKMLSEINIATNPLEGQRLCERSKNKQSAKKTTFVGSL